MKINDEYIEILVARLVGIFLGILSYYFFQKNNYPTPKEFAPIYFGAVVLFFCLKRNKFKITEARIYARSYKFSFMGVMFIITTSFCFFLLGQFYLLGALEYPSPLTNLIKISDLSIISLVSAGIWIHFCTRLFYNDLIKSFSEKTISKYLEAPVQGWIIGLFIYIFIIILS